VQKVHGAEQIAAERDKENIAEMLFIGGGGVSNIQSDIENMYNCGLFTPNFALKFISNLVF